MWEASISHPRFIILISCITFCASSNLKRHTAYSTLLKEIEERDINVLVPPFTDDEKISLEIGFELHRVIALDSDKATLTVSGILIVAWQDSRLTWNNSDVDILLLSGKDVWQPQLGVSFATETKNQVIKASIIRISQTGRAAIQHELKTTVSCDIDVRYFPRDVQHCYLRLQPPLGFRQIIKVVKLPLVHNVDSTYIGEEWLMLGHKHEVVSTQEVNVSNGISEFPAYQVSFLLGRNNDFYFLTLLIPSFMLAIIMLVPFVLPPNLAQPKLVIPVTSFVSLNVYMILLEKTLPKSVVLPILGEVYATLLCVAVVTELLQAFTIKFYNCRKKDVPPLLSFFYLKILSRVLCHDVCHTKNHFPDENERMELQNTEANEEEQCVPATNSFEIVQKQWKSLSRINDRLGFFLCSMVLLLSFGYLVFRCYVGVDIPPTYRGLIKI